MKRFITVAVASTLCVFASLGLTSFERTENATVSTVAAESHTVETTVLIPTTKVEIATGSYEIKSDDTLFGISQTLFGSESYLPVIYGQNSETIENAATSFGFVDSDNGHWIFPGSVLSISLPVITRTFTATSAVNQTESTTQTATAEATTSQTQTTTATVTATVASPTLIASATSTATPSATSTSVATKTSTQTPVASSTPTVRVSTPTLTSSATSTQVALGTPSATPTATMIPFNFSPTLPIVSENSVTFYISTYFGQETAESPKGHRGVDIANSQRAGGFEIHAIEEGQVVFSGWNVGGYGYEVTILHPNGLASLYGHLLEKPDVSIGQQVSKGQMLGKMGNTGYSTGPHLHLEIQDSDGSLLNPSSYLDLDSLNSVPSPSPAPEPLKVFPKKLTLVGPLGGFSKAFDQMKQRLIWDAAVRKNQENLRNIWIWNSAVAQFHQKQAEDLAIVSFFLVPWVKNFPEQEADKVGVEQELTIKVSANFVRSDATVYVNYLRLMAAYYGSEADMMIATMGCENETWNPNVDYIDSDGTQTAGIGQFKIGTYQSAASRMGLPEEQVENWKDPFNQLKVMAWKFAVGEAGAWTGYRNLVNLGRCRE